MLENSTHYWAYFPERDMEYELMKKSDPRMELNKYRPDPVVSSFAFYQRILNARWDRIKFDL